MSKETHNSSIITVFSLQDIRFKQHLNKYHLLRIFCVFACVYVVSRIRHSLASTQMRIESSGYTVKHETHSLHLHEKLALEKVLLSLPQSVPSYSSLRKPDPKSPNRLNGKTPSGVEYVTGKTLQHAYRRLPDIHIQSGENKSLEVLLERGDIEPATDLVTQDTKVILWYSPTRYHPVLSRLHSLRGCPDSRCRVTTNRDFHKQSDALVFTAQLLDRMPPVKLPNQVWILHNHESPRWVNKHTYLYTESWRSKFNWTMDYRDDADVKAPYGIFKKKNGTFLIEEHPPTKHYSQIWASKNGTVAWMVSNCRANSKRMEYVRELSKYVQVDIFGGCGNHKCPRSDDDLCMEYISKNYKFYLAFENALCKDYITEKFFRYFNSDMILVTRGGGNYSDIAPQGTFINAADFMSPHHLAQRLLHLAQNETAYVNILRRTNMFHAVWEEWPIVKDGIITYMTYHYDAQPMCEICNRLWDAASNETFYTNIGKWFDKGLCYKPSDLPSDLL